MSPRVITVCLLVLLSGTLFAESRIDRDTLRQQIALEREGFSPGLIDGKPGRKTTIALNEYLRFRGLPPNSESSVDALEMHDPVLPDTIEATDLKDVTGPNPRGWIEKSNVKKLGYESNLEALAERFHTSRALLQQLNPSFDFSRAKPGDTIEAPDLDALKTPRAHRLEIDLAQKIIYAKDASDRTVALFHCSIAKSESKRPSGSARVTSITSDPVYQFDPKMWPEVKGVNRKLQIPPGPRNPVGRCWIALSLPGYGIHGTPNPELIGKTGSHGCFRLTNWDAQRLGAMVQPGISVQFIMNR